MNVKTPAPKKDKRQAFSIRAPARGQGALSPSGAFTLVELASVLGVLACLVGVLTPALSHTSPEVKSARCLANLQRLSVAWQMYAVDSGDRILPGLHGSFLMVDDPDSTYGAAWANGWLDWTTSTDNTNVNYLINPKYSRLASYVGQQTNLFRCPADNFLSAAQRQRGWSWRVRSYSINIGLGAGNALGGPWDPLYKQIKRTSEFIYPGPAQNYVFLEEHPDSINDGAFFAPYSRGWIDNPATHHSSAAAFSFADGHAEMHRWGGSLLRLRGINYNFSSPAAPTGDPDVHWVSYHAGRSSTNSY